MRIEDRLDRMMRDAAIERPATEAEWRDFVGQAHRRLYLRRAVAATGAVAILALGVVVSADALTGDGNGRPLPPAGSPTEAKGPERVKVPLSEQELWFVTPDNDNPAGDRLSWSATAMGGPLPEELATGDPTADKAAFWLGILLAGPMGPNLEAGEATAIPSGTKLLEVRREGSRLYVDLSSEIRASDNAFSLELGVAQIVYTATQFEGIDSVSVLAEGSVFQLNSVNNSQSVDRSDFERYAPPIVLTSPLPGAKISSPVGVEGFANVFEATVNIEILDGNGDAIAEGFTTAACGTGCWGDFFEEVEFLVYERQRGRLNVLNFSAEDGSPQNVISIPVILVP